MKNNRNEIKPRKVIAFIGIGLVVVVLGIALDYHFFGYRNVEVDVAVAAEPSSLPMISPDFVYDGIEGTDTATVTPDATSETPSAQSSVPPVASASPAGTSSGSGGVPPSTSGESSGATSTTPTAGSTNSSGQVYVPGFGYVAPGGSGQSVVVDGDGDINKQVGTMG